MAKTKSADKGTNTDELDGESSEPQNATPSEPEPEGHPAMPATDVGGADTAIRTVEQAHGATSAKSKKTAPGTNNPNRSVADVMRFRRKIRTRR